MRVTFDTFRNHPLWFWMRVAVIGVFFAGGATSAADQTNELAQLKMQVVELQTASKWVEAEPLAEKLVTLTAIQKGENSDDTADALQIWAWLAQENGDYDKAGRLWLRALAIDEALYGKDTVQTTRRLHMLANLYRDQGDYEKAAPLLQKALAIREKHYGPDHQQTALVLISMAKLELNSGDFARAEANLLRALHIFEGAGPHNRKNVVSTLLELGSIYEAIGDFNKEQTMMSRALELQVTLTGLEHLDTTGPLLGLAVVYRSKREYEKAESLHQQSLAINQRLLGTNHASSWVTLNELGSIYLARGELVKAESALRQAEEILEKNLGPEHLRLAEVCMGLSRIYETREDYQTAHDLCSRAYRIREKHLGASHYLTLTSLRQQVRLDIVLGHSERALAAATDKLQQGAERLLANILSFTSEQQRLTYLYDVFQDQVAIWVDLGATKSLTRTILRTKGVVLDSLLEDRLLAEGNDNTEVRQLVTQITRARRRLDQLIPTLVHEERRTSTGAEMESVSHQIESLEAALARHVTGSGHARRALSVTVEQVQSAIPEDTVLLEMLCYEHYVGKRRYEWNYGVLILSRSEPPRWVCLGPADRIEKFIKLYKHAVRNSDASEAPVQVLHDLYDTVGAPVFREFPAGTKQVIVSPDGELNFVSFATLLTPGNRFLGEEFLFSYVSCGRDLLTTNKTTTGTSQLVLWANPDFGTTPLHVTAASNEGAFTRTREMRDLSFRPLPGSQKEGEILRDGARKLGFDEAILYAGTKATEAELRRVSSPKALHLATHGFVLPQIASPLADEESFRTPGSESVVPRMNPMLRSGLALAGAQLTLRAWSEGKDVPADNDGIVTADEIGGLNLHGTWLVVLSACDTGAGEARAGEGVLGLRRGFVQAGAQNLLLTLWPIDDQNTAGLIPDFYAELGKTGSPRRALARVQRTWFQKLRVEKGIAEACRVAGPFILSFQGRPD